MNQQAYQIERRKLLQHLTSLGAESPARREPSVDWSRLNEERNEAEAGEQIERLRNWATDLRIYRSEQARYGHGGKRPGAGQPKLADEPTVRITITLTQSLAKKAERIGRSRSEGIRLALEAYAERD